jgi:hypothetical protein
MRAGSASLPQAPVPRRGLRGYGAVAGAAVGAGPWCRQRYASGDRCTRPASIRLEYLIVDAARHQQVGVLRRRLELGVAHPFRHLVFKLPEAISLENPADVIRVAADAPSDATCIARDASDETANLARPSAGFDLLTRHYGSGSNECDHSLSSLARCPCTLAAEVAHRCLLLSAPRGGWQALL